MRSKFLILLITVFIVSASELKAQFVFGNTGLLHLPTADMQADKTVMIGASCLNPAATPSRWYYYTFNHYINITILPFLELSYCTCLFSGYDMSGGGKIKQHFDRWANQDRDFSIRIRAIKEDQFFRGMPAIVIGANDFLHTGGTAQSSYIGFWKSGNGYWGRLYVAMTKHFLIKNACNIGLHLAYMYNEREDFLFKGPGAGLELRFALESPSFFARALNGLCLMGEFDSRGFNIGGRYSLWRDHINFYGEFYGCRHPSAGLQLKMVLK